MKKSQSRAKLMCVIALPAMNEGWEKRNRKRKRKEEGSKNEAENKATNTPITITKLDDDNPFSHFAYKGAAIVKVSPYFSTQKLEENKSVPHQTLLNSPVLMETQAPIVPKVRVTVKVSPYFSTKKGVEVRVSPYFAKSQKNVRSKKDYLTAAQRRDDAYRKVTPDNTWKPPRSLHNLIQEDHVHDPWRVVVICFLLNLTSGLQVRKVISDFFSLCPDAKTATQVPQDAIERVIQSLGLQKIKTNRICKFSHQYIQDNWTHITQLHGVGNITGERCAPSTVKPSTFNLASRQMMLQLLFSKFIHTNIHIHFLNLTITILMSADRRVCVSPKESLMFTSTQLRTLIYDQPIFIRITNG